MWWIGDCSSLSLGVFEQVREGVAGEGGLSEVGESEGRGECHALASRFARPATPPGPGVAGLVYSRRLLREV